MKKMLLVGLLLVIIAPALRAEERPRDIHVENPSPIPLVKRSHRAKFLHTRRIHEEIQLAKGITPGFNHGRSLESVRDIGLPGDRASPGGLNFFGNLIRPVRIQVIGDHRRARRRQRQRNRAPNAFPCASDQRRTIV